MVNAQCLYTSNRVVGIDVDRYIVASESLRDARGRLGALVGVL
jgi:hypothetical protein